VDVSYHLSATTPCSSAAALFWTGIVLPIAVVGVSALVFGDATSSSSMGRKTNNDILDVFGLFQIGVDRVANTMAALAAIFTTLGLSEATTHTLKAAITRRRPNFYSMCKFDAATSHTCTSSNFWKCEAQFSFPSGHACLSMCASVFLCYYCVSHILRGPRITCKRLLIAATITILLGWALYVAATRLVDKYHHYDDVLAGCLLGFAVPTITFHLFYPPLWHATHVGIPWSIVALQKQQSSKTDIAATTG